MCLEVTSLSGDCLEVPLLGSKEVSCGSWHHVKMSSQLEIDNNPDDHFLYVFPCFFSVSIDCFYPVWFNMFLTSSSFKFIKFIKVSKHITIK